MKRIIIFIFGLIILEAYTTAKTFISTPAPINLTLEYLPSPILGIDKPRPRFGWKISLTRRAGAQTSYQIWVSSNSSVAAPDMWDSGLVTSSSSNNVVYRGKPLQSDTTYYWKVRYYDEQRSISSWSAAAMFHTGLFTVADWRSAAFITGFNVYRKAFSLSETLSNVHSAKLFICGYGYFEASMNGQKIGDHVLDPAGTKYEKHLLYVTFDVKSMLVDGENAIGVLLGGGWYTQMDSNDPRGQLVALLSIKFRSGSIQSVVTDDSWYATQGWIVYDSVFNGERYDARLEIPGWNEPNQKFDFIWNKAEVATPLGAALSSQLIPPIRVKQVFTKPD
eukprot:TRINITY_DN11883_c0_g1_i1.p1 TRINITY_DN11883_c0_g1~~TRINITY_DN11883_c0_g1_i1.p1  ORF type:complete len:335 (-),score=19.37 TRINITY_DN11883_c0_g1_i1:386-1390(-)